MSKKSKIGKLWNKIKDSTKKHDIDESTANDETDTSNPLYVNYSSNSAVDKNLVINNATTNALAAPPPPQSISGNKEQISLAEMKNSNMFSISNTQPNLQTNKGRSPKQSENDLLSPEDKSCCFDKKQNELASSFQRSFANSLELRLPITELNSASIRSDILMSMLKDKIENLDNSLTQTEDKTEEVSKQMKNIISKSHSLLQSATLVNSKIEQMDDWIESIDPEKSNIKIQSIEILVSFFSFLTTVFSLIWFSLKRKSNKPYRT